MPERTCKHEMQLESQVNSCDPKGNPIIYNLVNQNIVVTRGKEINRDSISSGERTWTSLFVRYETNTLE